jgi:hypothetical protein
VTEKQGYHALEEGALMSFDEEGSAFSAYRHMRQAVDTLIFVDF